MTELDDRVGQDAAIEPAIPPRLDAYLARLARRNPRKLAAVVAGFDFSAPRLADAVRSGLAPYLTLPAAEARTLKRARLAEAIARRVSADGCVTREDLLGAGFDAGDLDRLFGEALRAARVHLMVV